jgi:hypothetical protein
MPTPASVPRPSAQDDAIHLCHCMHGHFGTSVATPGLQVISPVDVSRVFPLVGKFVGPSFQPPLRPPIA